ncbi:O-acyltransferase like protein-like, partial [Sitodiplosis mosellana]|uniref:O-acyltransferase like protein-like n=1 Tax=Sitodiplosis mosellana TaxID=263140 RepID=UPI0024444400
MVSILSLILVLVVQSMQLVHGGYKISEFKYELFGRDRLASFRAFESQNLDENFFLSDYTKAPRHYNTSKCIDDLLDIQNNLRNGDRESMMLLDAWGDVPSGLFVHHSYDYGAYDECLNVQIETEGENDKDAIKAQYCLMDFNYMSEPVTVGICMPESCSPQLFESMLNKMAYVNETLFRIPYKRCQLKDDYATYTTTDKTAIAIFTMILGLIIASTIYDGVCLSRQVEANKTLLAFSVHNNCKKWLTFEQSTSPDVIGCMNGIRVLSRLWNLVLHTGYRYMTVPSNPNVGIFEFIFSDMLVQAAPFCVDIFFLLSGTLTSLTILKQLKRTNGKLNVAPLYLHRILRLIPLLAGTILFMVSLFRFCGSGPAWYTTESYRTNCETNWWSTLLHVQNYLNTHASHHNICIPQSWYLAADFHLFLIAPFFVYLLRKYEWKMVPVIVVLLACGVALLIFSWPLDSTNPLDQTTFGIRLRVPTHLRYSPYLIGLFLGFIFFKNRGKKVYISRMWNAFGWSMSIIIIILTIFGHYPFHQPDIDTLPIHFVLFLSFGRILWTVAVGWIMFSCHFGYGGAVNMILSLSLWSPLSKLTYAIYITHDFVVMMTMASGRFPLYFTRVSM